MEGDTKGRQRGVSKGSKGNCAMYIQYVTVVHVQRVIEPLE
jgi:hypothetical protein